MNTEDNISLWVDQIDFPATPRPSLEQNMQADVAIMGGGYTGLWTAYYLKKNAPHLNVVVLEAKYIGYGASGRNGGWLMGEITGQDKLLEKLPEDLKHQAHDLVHGIPDEVARILQAEKIDCDYQKGGVLYVAARYPEQTERLKDFYDFSQQQGYHDKDYQWLDSEQLKQKIKIHSAQAAIYSPHCARIHPAKLVRGLAQAVENLGVSIYEYSPVTHWQKGQLTTANASVQANWIVPAVEAYGADLKNSVNKLKKYHLPVQSLIIATEPLSEEMWFTMGMDNDEAFSDYSRQVTYGIRTKDNRLVFGARGSYQFGAKLRQDFKLTDDEVALRRNIMVELFPQLKNTKITHAWGGNLAIAREFHPHMTLDTQQQFAIAGGYGGEGVGASNLAGRTLADLILGKDSLLTKMPWVNINTGLNKLKGWEPEPIPWIGYRSVIYSFDREDKILSNHRSSKLKRKLSNSIAKFMERFVQ